MSVRNWPNPVIDQDGDDYPGRAFQAAFVVEERRPNYGVKVRCDLGSDTLRALIDEGRAQYVVRVSCGRTNFRQSYPAKTPEWDFMVEESRLRDSFYLQAFVVATQDFAFSSAEWASWFAGLEFEVKCGAILAIGAVVEFIAEKQDDELKSLRSIIQVTPHPTADIKEMTIDYESDRITIFLPVDTMPVYTALRACAPYTEVFICSLVVPALIGAIRIIAMEDEGAHGDRRWKRTVRSRLKALGVEKLDSDDALGIVQKLLDMPFLRLFDGILKQASDQGYSDAD